MFYKTSSVKIVRAHRLVEGESLWRPTPNRTGDNLLLPQTNMPSPAISSKAGKVWPRQATVAVQSLAYYCTSADLIVFPRRPRERKMRERQAARGGSPLVKSMSHPGAFFRSSSVGRAVAL